MGNNCENRGQDDSTTTGTITWLDVPVGVCVEKSGSYLKLDKCDAASNYVVFTEYSDEKCEVELVKAVEC